MITAWVSLEEVCGPHLRAALRASLRRQHPLVVIVDARGQSTAATSDNLTFTLQLRRLARRGGGDVVLISDKKLQRKLRATRLDAWLSVSTTEAEALAIAASLFRTLQLARH